MWNGRRQPRAPTSAPHFLPRARGELGLGHSVLPPARMCTSWNVVAAVRSRLRGLLPLGALSQRCPPESVDARGTWRPGAQLETVHITPKIPGARKALAGWGKVGDRALEPADLIPLWQTGSELSWGNAFRTDTNRGTPALPAQSPGETFSNFPGVLAPRSLWGHRRTWPGRLGSLPAWGPGVPVTPSLLPHAFPSTACLPCVSTANHATQTFQSLLTLCHLQFASAGAGERRKRPPTLPPSTPLLASPSHLRPPERVQTLQVWACGGGAPEGTDSAGDGVRAASPTLSASAVPPPPPPPRLRRRDLWACNLVLFKFSPPPPFSFLKIFFFSFFEITLLELKSLPAFQFPCAGIRRRILRAGRVVLREGPGAPRPRFLQLGFVSLGDPPSWRGANSWRSSASRQASWASTPPHPAPYPARAAAAVGSGDVFIPV